MATKSRPQFEVYKDNDGHKGACKVGRCSYVTRRWDKAAVTTKTKAHVASHGS